MQPLKAVNLMTPMASSHLQTAPNVRAPESSFVPLFHGTDPQPKRPPGRPKGSKAAVVQDPRALGVHHFAFVRSSILGLDLAEAFERYMAWSDSTTDLRHVQNRRETLLRQIIEAGRQFDATLPAHSKIAHLLDLLRSDATVKPAVVLPSLDEWVENEGMDPEGWSEADLMAEYRAAFGLDNVDAIEAAEGLKDPVGERVRALNYLETVLATIPSATDRLETWFAKPVVKCLRNVGIVTLADLGKRVAKSSCGGLIFFRPSCPLQHRWTHEHSNSRNSQTCARSPSCSLQR